MNTKYTSFSIAGRAIGPDQPPFIILEAGINHNGQLDLALEMIRVAKQAGADAIKFQTFKAEEFVADVKQMFTYKSQGKVVTESMLEMFRRYQFNPAEWQRIKAYCDETGIIFISTPQNVSDLEILLECGVPAAKIGSDDFTNLPLLKRYAQTRLPLILSCGMSDLADVYKALEAVGYYEGYPVALLVCTSEYPTPADSVNISRLSTLACAFKGLLLGFSDHTQGERAAVMATALGACIFEKHFTLDHNLPGPDHWFSDNLDEAVKWGEAIRDAYRMRGNGRVVPSEMEKHNKNEFQRVMVAAQPIRRGEQFSEDNITFRRVQSGAGWSPAFFGRFKGKIAHRNFSIMEPIDL